MLKMFVGVRRSCSLELKKGSILADFIYLCRLTIKAACPMDLRKFPMDTQHCPLTIESCKSGFGNPCILK